MFGFSLAELLVVLLVGLIFIKPKDLPEIANFAGKAFFRAKKALNDLKKQFTDVEDDLGLKDLKHELNRGIAEESAKLKDLEATIIVDMHGNEHRVHDLGDIRNDLSPEEVKQEVQTLNDENLRKKALEAPNTQTTNSDQTPTPPTKTSLSD